jgi:hypothetical protein
MFYGVQRWRCRLRNSAFMAVLRVSVFKSEPAGSLPPRVSAAANWNIPKEFNKPMYRITGNSRSFENCKGSYQRFSNNSAIFKKLIKYREGVSITHVKGTFPLSVSSVFLGHRLPRNSYALTIGKQNCLCLCGVLFWFPIFLVFLLAKRALYEILPVLPPMVIFKAFWQVQT